VKKESSLSLGCSNKYFPNNDDFNAAMASRPSFSWCNVLEMNNIIIQDSKCLAGDSASLNIWESRWILRPIFFFEANHSKT